MSAILKTKKSFSKKQNEKKKVNKKVSDEAIKNIFFDDVQEYRRLNKKLFNESLFDAKLIFKENGLDMNQSDIISITASLFNKRAQHIFYFMSHRY